MTDVPPVDTMAPVVLTLRVEDAAGAGCSRRGVEQNDFDVSTAIVPIETVPVVCTSKRGNDRLRRAVTGDRRVNRNPVLAREVRRSGDALELLLELRDFRLNLGAIDARSSGAVSFCLIWPTSVMLWFTALYATSTVPLPRPSAS